MDFFLKLALYPGALLSIVLSTTGEELVSRPENVRWVSFNFKTLLTWGPAPRNYTYTVLLSELDADSVITPDCLHIPETECDLSNYLWPLNRTYLADIQAEPTDWMKYDPEEFVHSFSPHFNPYRQSQITAASFRLEMREVNSSVALHITDPLTTFYHQGRLLTVRDVLKADLKYKISYHKARSTGKKELVFESSVAEILRLEPGQSYCFSVAAFIPSRAADAQLGAWSQQQCTPVYRGFLEELSVGALVGGFFVLLVLLAVITALTVVCCRRQRLRQNKSLRHPPAMA